MLADRVQARVRKLHKRTGDVEIGTQAEADVEGITYVYWREARPGDRWVLSDDGWVVPVKYVREIVEKRGNSTRTRRRVATHVAVRYPHGKRPLLVEEAVTNRNFDLTGEPWWKLRDRAHPALRSMLTKAVLAGQLHMNSNRRYNRDEYQVFIHIADKVLPRNYNWYQVRTFFNHEGVRNMIRTDLAQKAKARGWDIDYVFDLLEEAQGMARVKVDSKALRAIAHDIANIIDKPIVAKQNKQLPYLTTPGELAGEDLHFQRFLDKHEVTDVDFADVGKEDA